MEKENIFQRVLRFLENNNINMQEFVEYLSTHAGLGNGVKIRYTDESQSAFYHPEKAANGIMIGGNLWMGLDTDGIGDNWEEADRTRRNYAFVVKTLDPEKVYCRLPAAEEADEIYKNLTAVNQKLNLLKKPLIQGKYWLSSTAERQHLIYDMDEGKVMISEDDEDYQTLVIIEDVREH